MMAAVVPSGGSRDVHRIRVMITADVRLYREGLAASLAKCDHLLVAAVSANRTDARVQAAKLRPHVVVVDVATTESLELIRDLRREAAETRILAFAVQEVTSDIIHCAEAGADGYVAADATIADLVSAIERIAHEELVCSPRVAAGLFRHISESSDGGAGTTGHLHALTSREHQVLDFIRRGHSNKEIARALNISEPTVKNHVHHLLEKLNVPSRAQAAARASLPARTRRLSDPSRGMSHRIG